MSEKALLRRDNNKYNIYKEITTLRVG